MMMESHLKDQYRHQAHQAVAIVYLVGHCPNKWIMSRVTFLKIK